MKHRNLYGIGVILCAAFAALLAGCKAEEEIVPGPTPKPVTPEVVVNQELIPPEHIIEVHGSGVVIAAPDFATITLTVQGNAETAEQASAICEENRGSVYDVALATGVREADITSTGATITAIQREADGAITGYNALDTITITASDVSTANSVMSSILDASVSELKSVSYSLTDSSAAYQEALKAAVADAKQKADSIAEASGVTLGTVIGVLETATDEDSVVGVAFESSAIAVPAKVTVQYRIKD